MKFLRECNFFFLAKLLPKNFKYICFFNNLVLIKCNKRKVKEFFFFFSKQLCNNFKSLIDISVVDFSLEKKKFFLFYHLLSNL
jgi:NADH:ubiquinone oxidoreductase subunit C